MLRFEKLQQDRKLEDDEKMFDIYRAKIPGGWLVLMQNFDYEYRDRPDTSYGYGWGYGGATFVPDPNHIWDGSSI